jgi:hypothetical protein
MQDAVVAKAQAIQRAQRHEITPAAMRAIIRQADKKIIGTGQAIAANSATNKIIQADAKVRKGREVKP